MAPRPRKVIPYGGGQSWLLAMAQNQILQPDGTTRPWTSPRGVPVRLAAAVPQYPWTDLAQALVDNGRASDGLSGAPADRPHTDPIGVDKQSDVAGLYALGQSTAQYATNDPTADLPGWFAPGTGGRTHGAPRWRSPRGDGFMSTGRGDDGAQTVTEPTWTLGDVTPPT